MKYICFDTSSRTLLLSACNGRGEMEIKAREIDKFGSLLAVMVEQAIENLKIEVPKLDFIGVGVGPGSLTGLRVGIATAKGIAFPYDIRVVPFNCLDVLASSIDDERFIVLRRGREGHYYWREYRERVPVRETEFSSTAELVSAIDLSGTKLFFDGEIEQAFERFDCSEVRHQDPSAMREIAVEKFAAGEFIRYSDLKPIYLQKSIAEINWENRKTEKSH